MAKLPINKGEDYVYIDDELETELSGKHWTGDGRAGVGRVYRHLGKLKRQSLAFAVMGEPLGRGEKWGRRDGDWRNFCRENLIVVPKGQHLKEHRAVPFTSETARSARKNPLGYVGVTKAGKKFRAYTTINGEGKYLNLHETMEEAARAVDDALIAAGLKPVNFPDGEAPAHSPTFQERVEQIRASGDRASLKSMLAGKLSARQRKVLLELAAEFL